jgi:hypothetical protein
MLTKALTPDETLELIRSIEGRIPGYTQLTDKEAQRLRRAAFVNPNFIVNILLLIDASSSLARALDRTSDDVRREDSEADAWDAVATKLLGLYQGVVAANLVRRHRVGLFTLQAYNIARQLARRTDDVDVTRVAELKKLEKWKKLKDRRRRQTPTSP